MNDDLPMLTVQIHVSYPLEIAGFFFSAMQIVKDTYKQESEPVSRNQLNLEGYI